MAEPQPKTSTSKRSGGRTNAKAKSGGSATKKRASQTRNASNRGTRSTAKASGTTRTARNSSAKSNGAKSQTATRASSNGRAGADGATGTIKGVASKAAGPAVAVGAAAVGVAGGLLIRSRTRRKTVLGVPVPKRLPTVDPKAIAKSVGSASKRFAKTSKSVSKDIERAGDQAEKIGKILS
jgi:hypothetical protein